MADQIPPVSGAPGDAEWYRWAQDHITDLERERDRARLESEAGSMGLGASLASLSDQVRDLAGRVSYAADGTGASASWSSLQADNTPFGPPLVFTTSETRMVSVQFAVRAIAEATATSASTVIVSAMRGMIFVNGSPTVGARGEVGVSVPSIGGSSFRYDYSIGTLTCRTLISLPAGTHTVQGGFAFRNVDVLAGPGSGSLTASDPSIFVDILQTTGA